MVCYHPLVAWQHVNVKPNGKKAIVFNMPPVNKLHLWMQINIPCGQCIGCRLDYSRQWAVRCVHEAKMHEKNCFITLTYDDEHVPWSHVTGEQTLVKKHHQDFLKRLRDYFYPQKIRFYLCGEYGETTHRPHYHAILFGFDFPDKQLYKISPLGYKYYMSPILNKLWKHGHCMITDVTFDSCAYVARYIMKKVKGEIAKDYYYGVQPEYVCMSRRPGIAAGWFEKYKGDVYPYDEVVIRSNGKIRRLKPPRYYDKLYDLEEPEKLAVIKERRAVKGKAKEEEIYNGRLATKERYKKLVIKKLERKLD